MLKPVSASRTKPGKRSGGRFAIVASRYNAKYVDAMVQAAQAHLHQAGIDALELIRVPGAFEIPVAAAALASRSAPKVDAILCLGVILRGATTHAQHIGEAVSLALAQLQLMHRTPVIHEVLLLENESQARQRCLNRRTNRGLEAAQTALEMAQIMQSLRKRAR